MIQRADDFDPDLDLVLERVVDVPPELVWKAWTEPEGDGTRYTARGIHGDREARDEHEEMGFHEGWSTVLDQFVELAKTM